MSVTEGRIQDFENLRLLVDAVGLREILALIQPVVALFDLNISLTICSRLLLLNAKIPTSRVGDQLTFLDLIFLDTISALRRCTRSQFPPVLIGSFGERHIPVVEEFLAEERHDDTGILPGDLSVVIEIVAKEYNLTRIA